MRWHGLCESAKKGRVCVDDVCRASDITLCGFDKYAYEEIMRDWLDEDDDYNYEYDGGSDDGEPEDGRP